MDLIDLSMIKQFLRLAGITNLHVQFDDNKRQIEATFIKAGRKRTKLIKFTEIEELFTRKPYQAPAGPPAAPTGPSVREFSQDTT